MVQYGMTIASIALSGLNASQARLNTAAHNIANSQTEDFHRQRVQQTALPQGGTSVSVSTSETPGADLIQDTVDSMASLYAFRANTMVLKTHDRMLGTLLDTKV